MPIQCIHPAIVGSSLESLSRVAHAYIHDPTYLSHNLRSHTQLELLVPWTLLFCLAGRVCFVSPDSSVFQCSTFLSLLSGFHSERRIHTTSSHQPATNPTLHTQSSSMLLEVNLSYLVQPLLQYLSQKIRSRSSCNSRISVANSVSTVEGLTCDHNFM